MYKQFVVKHDLKKHAVTFLAISIKSLGRIIDLESHVSRNPFDA